MGGGRRLGWCWLLAGLAALGPGCNRQDADRLARVGRKVVERAEEASGGVTTSLTTGWQGVRANMDAGGLDARVSSRLRWDKSLADFPIEVSARGGIVELKGTVQNLTQRRRAVELATSTVGTEQVIDLIVVPEPSP